MFEEIHLSFVTFTKISLRIGRDMRLTESIHSHIIGVTFCVTFFLFCSCHDFTEFFLKLLIGQWCLFKNILINYSF